MTAPVPQHLGKAVLEEVERLINTETPPTQFELARLRRDADKLHAIDHSLAYLAESAIAALTWDVKSTRVLIEKALRLNKSAVMLANCALTMRSIGFPEESCEYALAAMHAEPADMSFLVGAVEQLSLVGRWNEALKLVDMAKAKSMKLEASFMDFEGHLRFLHEEDISLDRLKFELKCANLVLREAHVRHRGIDIDLIKDPETSQQTLVIQTICYGTIEDELRLDSALGQLLASEPGWNPEKLAVEIACTQEDAYQSA